MKKQINIGNGNTQTSSDPNTTQVQIGFSKTWTLIIITGILGYLFLSDIVQPWVINTLCENILICN